MFEIRENEISLRNSLGDSECLRTSQGTFLTMQRKWTFTKRFILFTLQRKCPTLPGPGTRGAQEGSTP